MRYYPKDKYELEEAKELNAPEWMLECLKKNPSYCSWGNYEDYMCEKRGLWNSPFEISSVDELWRLDDLNELVNFYFEVERESESCEECDGKEYVYTEDTPHLGLQMWIIHPRKGCSRGVYLKDIQKDELDKVCEYLKNAALRNAKRFANL